MAGALLDHDTWVCVLDFLPLLDVLRSACAARAPRHAAAEPSLRCWCALLLRSGDLAQEDAELTPSRRAWLDALLARRGIAPRALALPARAVPADVGRAGAFRSLRSFSAPGMWGGQRADDLPGVGCDDVRALLGGCDELRHLDLSSNWVALDALALLGSPATYVAARRVTLRSLCLLEVTFVARGVPIDATLRGFCAGATCLLRHARELEVLALSGTVLRNLECEDRAQEFITEHTELWEDGLGAAVRAVRETVVFDPATGLPCAVGLRLPTIDLFYWFPHCPALHPSKSVEGGHLEMVPVATRCDSVVAAMTASSAGVTLATDGFPSARSRAAAMARLGLGLGGAAAAEAGAAPPPPLLLLPGEPLLDIPCGRLSCGACGQVLYETLGRGFLRGAPTQPHISYELFTDEEPSGATRPLIPGDASRRMLNCARGCHASRDLFLLAGAGGSVDTKGFRYGIAVGPGLVHEEHVEEGAASARPGKVCARPGCEERGTDRCRRCKIVHYCSRACQKEHWKVHRPSCFHADPVGDATQALQQQVGGTGPGSHAHFAQMQAYLAQQQQQQQQQQGNGE